MLRFAQLQVGVANVVKCRHVIGIAGVSGQESIQGLLVAALLYAGNAQGEMALGAMGVSGHHAPGLALHEVKVTHLQIVADLFLEVADQVIAGGNFPALGTAELANGLLIR